MKIILISSGVLPVPPLGYGGLEQVVFDLAVCLDKLGREVYVIAPSESTIKEIGNIKLIDCGPCTPNAQQWEMEAYDKYLNLLQSEEFKGAVIHDHSWKKMIYLAKINNPSLNITSTLHGMLPYHKPPPIPKPSFIGISKYHADSISAGLGIPVRVVYDGIDLDKYQYNDKDRNDRYLFLARITTFKGAHVFLDAMKQLGLKGDLVGDDTLVEDREYVERILIGCNDYPNVRYWGGVPRERAIEFFRTSKCYVLPLDYINWCVTPDTIIRTNPSFKQINEILEGDMVYNLQGDSVSVDKVMKKHYKGEMFEITPSLLRLPVKMTPEHRVLTLQLQGCKRGGGIVPCKPNSYYSRCKTCKEPLWERYMSQWKPVQFIQKGDYLAYPIMRKSTITSFIPEMFELFGLYLGDGSTRGKKGIGFYFHKNEIDSINKTIELMTQLFPDIPLQQRTRGNCTEIYTWDITTREFFLQFGHNAFEKKLPQSMIGLDKIYYEYCMKGLLASDGWRNKTNNINRLNYVTISRALAYQIVDMLLYLDKMPNMRKRKQTGKGDKDIYEITWSENKGLWSGYGVIWNNKYWMPLKEKKSFNYSGEVYDLYISQKNSYVAETIITHNSEPFGLTFVEAMACGLPVITTNSGSTPELIEHGKSGYVLNNYQDLTIYLKDDKVTAIKSADCRNQAEKFSREAMTLNYIKCYEELLEKGGW